jgi:hypothetical protein
VQRQVRLLIEAMRRLRDQLHYSPSRSGAALAARRAVLTHATEGGAVGAAEDTLRRALNVPLVPVS